MQLKFNIEKKHLYFLIGVILIIGIAIFVVAQQYPQQNPGHMWSEMDCDGNLCVKNGNVGIGTTNPTQSLQVGRADEGNGAYDGQIVIGKTNGEGSKRLFKMGLDPNYYFSIGYYGWTGNENYEPLLTITSNGKVGIGTNTPEKPLQVGGDAGAEGIIRTKASDGEESVTFWDIGVSPSGDNMFDFVIKDARPGPGIIVIDYSTGDVGIGTDTPSAKLHVEGDILINDADDDKSKITFQEGTTNMYSIVYDGESNSPNNYLRIRGDHSDYYGTLFKINQEGNAFIKGDVGIGTPEPDEKLHVKGNIKATGTICNGENNCIGSGDGGGGSGTVTWVKQGTATSVSPTTSGAAEYTVSVNCNSVLGHACGYDNYAANTDYCSGGTCAGALTISSGDGTGIHFENDNKIWWDGGAYIQSFDGGSMIDLVGALRMNTIGAGYDDLTACWEEAPPGSSFYLLGSCGSSIRYKENIKDLKLGLEEVEKLKPRTFNWKNSGDEGFGFIAEEAYHVSPLFVTYKDGQIDGVRYRELTAVLVNAIQEQQEQIEEMKEIICKDQPKQKLCK